MTMTRRDWMARATTLSAGGVALASGCAPRGTNPAAETDSFARFPGKVAMRVVNDRPPCLETPWSYYRTDITPNEAFYVRWHLQAIPPPADLAIWRLKIDGAVERPLELSMADLERMGASEVVAVNQCSGNSRALFTPRVAGAQWRDGAMGNARWGGVALAKLLRAAGVKKDADCVAFDGLDVGPLASTPDFVKTLSIDHALSPEVLVAHSMNNQPLPWLNGFPARLVVPGWYATYWVKALARITVLPRPFDGYWMTKAYKLPKTPNGVEDPTRLAADLVPISRLNARSFFTSPDPDSTLPLNQTSLIEGIAFDGGGVQRVEVSVDPVGPWQDAILGDDLGPFSFRRWRFAWNPPSAGVHRLRVRATGRVGGVQPETPGWNRGGYMRNVVEQLTINVV